MWTRNHLSSKSSSFFILSLLLLPTVAGPTRQNTTPFTPSFFLPLPPIPLRPPGTSLFPRHNVFSIAHSRFGWRFLFLPASVTPFPVSRLFPQKVIFPSNSSLPFQVFFVNTPPFSRDDGHRPLWTPHPSFAPSLSSVTLITPS